MTRAMKTIKLAVITGNRQSVIDFFKYFKDVEVKFIKLEYYSVLGIDPFALIKSNRGNLSWTYIRNLEDQIKDCNAVYMSDTYYFSCLQIVNITKKNNIPLFTEVWTTIPNHITTCFPPYSWITKQVVKNTKLFILRSKNAYKFTDSLKIPRNKTVMIYKGIDVDKFNND